MTIERRNGKYRVRVFSKRHPLTGRREVLTGTYGKLSEARKAETDFKTQARTTTDHHRDTLAAYLDRWQKGRKIEVAATTWERQGQLIETVRPHIGALKLKDLSPDDLKALYALLLTEGRIKGAGGLAPRTVGHVHRMLHKALHDAERAGTIYRNPAAIVSAPKVQKVPVDVPSPETLQRFVETIRGDRLYPVLMLLYATGLRRGEALALRWADIDIERLFVTVNRSAVRVAGKTIIKPTKSGRGRSVRLPSSLALVIEDHRKAQLKEMMRKGYRNTEGLFITNTRGEVINPKAFTPRVRTLAEKAGVKLSPHLLRHAHATLLLQAGVHPKVAQERLGHSTISVTLDIYSHVIQGMQDAAADATETALSGMLKD
ncbi:site-specific integrase [Limibacillus sp. MBR-115]|jgi:integrase|uniref:tyrosine-type recombinase/integrase n=1 Tax=Limibacillus sp. MBR-115 TaxID=3156465 RepID=UPI003397C5FB